MNVNAKIFQFVNVYTKLNHHLKHSWIGSIQWSIFRIIAIKTSIISKYIDSLKEIVKFVYISHISIIAPTNLKVEYWCATVVQHNHYGSQAEHAEATPKQKYY